MNDFPDDYNPELDDAQAADEEEKAQLAAQLNQYSEAFDKLCRERHEVGAKEYGETTFLGNDVVRMMIEELVDTANYCRMQVIKLMLLQNALEEHLSESFANPTSVTGQEGIEIGTEGFKGTRDVGWNK